MLLIGVQTHLAASQHTLNTNEHTRGIQYGRPLGIENRETDVSIAIDVAALDKRKRSR